MRIYFSEENAATLNDRYEQCKQKYKLMLKQTSSNTLDQLQALLELAKAAHQLEGKEECTQMLQSTLDAGLAEASPAWQAALLRELAVANDSNIRSLKRWSFFSRLCPSANQHI